MRAGKFELKRRVWIGLLFALGVTSWWWFWSRARIPITAKGTPSMQPVVRLPKPGTSVGNAMRERAEYFDPTPLFFPTEWNFGQGALRESMKRQPGDVFGSIDAQFVFGEQNIKPYNAGLAAQTFSLAEVVAASNETPFGGMGESEAKPVVLAGRSGFLEVRTVSDGKPILEQTLVGVSIAHADFAPLEFLVVVGNSGMITEPILVSRSGWEDVDGYFRTYLLKTFRAGERLAPGMYRILIGP